MLIWIKDAPEYNGTNHEEVAKFIDKHVTCKKDDEIYNLVNYHCTGTVSNNEYDIGQDFGIARKRFENESLPMNEMSDNNYRSLVQSLNEKQKLFFYNVLNHFKTNETPLYTFLTGGAGVGKSVLLRSLYQALIKFFNHKVGENPDNLKVLLCARQLIT